MSSFTDREFCNRIGKLQSVLKERSIDAALIIQKVDLYYFCGTLQQGILFVPAYGQPKLFVKKDWERALEESYVKDVHIFKGLSDVYVILKDCYGGLSIIAMELDVLPVNLFKRYQEVFKEAQFVDFSNEIRRIRMIKSSEEIKKIKKSAELIDELYGEFKHFIKPGATELELAYELEYLARKKGHMGLVRMRTFNQEMFYGHLLSGDNGLKTSYVDSPTGGRGQGAYFSQGASWKKVKMNEPLSVDFVFNYEGYLVDMTRVFYLGSPTSEYLKAYGVAKDIHEWVLDNLTAGVKSGKIYSDIIKIAKEYGLEQIFMGPMGKTVPYIGHGVGLELDEFPVLAKGVEDEIVENVVFALEPKFFVPNEGIAGIESTYLMTNDGVLLLTKYPYDIQIIE